MDEQQEYAQRGMDTRDLGDVFVATQIEMWRRRINADNSQLGALVWELMQTEAKFAAVPLESLRYCFLTEMDERDDALWAEHSNRVEAWLQSRE